MKYGGMIMRLLEACELNRYEKIEKYITQGDDVNARDQKGNTAIMYTVYNNNLKATKLLIEHGAGIHAVNTAGRSALYYAVANHHWQLADYLKEWGAVLNGSEIRDLHYFIQYDKIQDFAIKPILTV